MITVKQIQELIDKINIRGQEYDLLANQTKDEKMSIRYVAKRDECRRFIDDLTKLITV